MLVKKESIRLHLLPKREYPDLRKTDPVSLKKSGDPLGLYYWPVVGRLYCRRVELCLEECTGGERILEVGFGSGVAFPNLHEMYEEVHGLDLNADIKEVGSTFRVKGIKTHLLNGDVLDMPYPDDYFDTVLLVSILEHLKPEEVLRACAQIERVLKPGGQMIYGVPVDRLLMTLVFRVTGFGADIRHVHFSTHVDVAEAAGSILNKVRIVKMNGIPSLVGPIYDVGHFMKAPPSGGRP